MSCKYINYCTTSTFTFYPNVLNIKKSTEIKLYSCLAQFILHSRSFARKDLALVTFGHHFAKGDLKTPQNLPLIFVEDSYVVSFSWYMLFFITPSIVSNFWGAVHT